MSDLFKNLNDRQIDAVMATEGKVRVVAGAGSGKTKVLTNRYAYLVNEVGIDPGGIVCLTFTNKAAGEMKKRISQLVHRAHVNDFTCTIHGFCVKFLRREIHRIGYPKNFAIIDAEDAKTLAKQVMEEMPGTEYSRDALLAIESIYQTDGRTDEYLDYAEKIGVTGTKTELERDQMYFNAAEQLYLTENYNKALTSLQNYLERFPDAKSKGKAEYYVADCYRFLGKKETACDWYTRAIEEDDNSSYLESAMLNFSRLSYDLQHYSDAYGGFSRLLEGARIDSNKHTARLGMMRSAFRGQDYSDAISCADKVRADGASTQDETREADYIKAKSFAFYEFCH